MKFSPTRNANSLLAKGTQKLRVWISFAQSGGGGKFHFGDAPIGGG